MRYLSYLSYLSYVDNIFVNKKIDSIFKINTYDILTNNPINYQIMSLNLLNSVIDYDTYHIDTKK